MAGARSRHTAKLNNGDTARLRFINLVSGYSAILRCKFLSEVIDWYEFLHGVPELPLVGSLGWEPVFGSPGFWGKGSPSAQTAPSSKCSFFQIGTVFLTLSISQRQASNAAARCGEATAMAMLVSPICRLPRR